MEGTSDHYTTAILAPEVLEKIKALEAELRHVTDKELILVAYEESEHNPT